ncbi:MAG: PAS domain S-box protein [Pseudomonadota bacterium]
MRHSKKTKEAAVVDMRSGERPLLDLAREYGVSTNTLRTWLRESEARARAQDSAKRVAKTLSGEKYTSASQRQRLLMHALEQSPATIIVTDAEGKIVYANPKFVETTGYAVDEVIGQNPRLLKSGETTPGEYRRLWKAITAGKEWRGTFHNRRKDGSLYWERASISPVFDANGRIANFMAVKEDITEYMEAEAARRRTAAGFHALFAALPSAVLLVDGLNRLLLANAAAEALIGVALPPGTRLDRLNLRWVDAAGTALDAETHPLRQVLAGEVETNGLDLRLGLVPPRGGTRWLRAALRTVRLPEEEAPAALLVLDAAD